MLILFSLFLLFSFALVDCSIAVLLSKKLLLLTSVLQTEPLIKVLYHILICTDGLWYRRFYCLKNFNYWPVCIKQSSWSKFYTIFLHRHTEWIHFFDSLWHFCMRVAGLTFGGEEYNHGVYYCKLCWKGYQWHAYRSWLGNQHWTLWYH